MSYHCIFRKCKQSKFWHIIACFFFKVNCFINYIGESTFPAAYVTTRNMIVWHGLISGNEAWVSWVSRPFQYIKAVHCRITDNGRMLFCITCILIAEPNMLYIHCLIGLKSVRKLITHTKCTIMSNIIIHPLCSH